jgi:hypothetical protein
VKEAHPALGPVAIRDALRLAGDNTASPDNNRGWGTPNAALAAVFPDGINLTGPAGVVPDNPLFSWTVGQVAAFAIPLLQYDVRVTRAGTGSREYEATGLTTASHAPGQALRRNALLRWQLTARLGVDTVATLDGGTFTIGDDSPALTLLFQNFPNPFPDRATGQRTTCVWFDLSTPGATRLDVLDLRGHLVRNLVPGTVFDSELLAGRYGRADAPGGSGCDAALHWDGTDANGTVMPRGIYLLRLSAPDGVQFKRVVFLGPDV